MVSSVTPPGALLAVQSGDERQGRQPGRAGLNLTLCATLRADSMMAAAEWCAGRGVDGRLNTAAYRNVSYWKTSPSFLPPPKTQPSREAHSTALLNWSRKPLLVAASSGQRRQSSSLEGSASLKLVLL